MEGSRGVRRARGVSPGRRQCRFLPAEEPEPLAPKVIGVHECGEHGRVLRAAPSCQGEGSGGGELEAAP